MNPLDRINQLNNEVALLRSQLSDARKQLEADSATIAKLAKDKRELVDCLASLRFFLEDNAKMVQPASDFSARIIEVDSVLSRHA